MLWRAVPRRGPEARGASQVRGERQEGAQSQKQGFGGGKVTLTRATPAARGDYQARGRPPLRSGRPLRARWAVPVGRELKI